MRTRVAFVLPFFIAGMVAFSALAIAAPAKSIGTVSIYPDQPSEVLLFQ